MQEALPYIQTWILAHLPIQHGEAFEHSDLVLCSVCAAPGRRQLQCTNRAEGNSSTTNPSDLLLFHTSSWHKADASPVTCQGLHTISFWFSMRERQQRPSWEAIWHFYLSSCVLWDVLPENTLAKQLCGLQTQNSPNMVGSVDKMQPSSSTGPLKRAIHSIQHLYHQSGVPIPTHPHPLTLLMPTAISSMSPLWAPLQPL